MDTSFKYCSGHPFNFQPMYNTARPQNSITWSVLQSGILTEYEIGHFVPCTTLTHAVTLANTPSITAHAWAFCHGPYEAAGPPDPSPAGQEPTDLPCYNHGDTHGPLRVPPNEVTGCLDFFTQNGDRKSVV